MSAGRAYAFNLPTLTFFSCSRWLTSLMSVANLYRYTMYFFLSLFIPFIDENICIRCCAPEWSVACPSVDMNRMPANSID